MARGGRRENAGRKSTWASEYKFSETKLIRVPEKFASQLLEMAHKLDNGESLEIQTEAPVDLETESNGANEKLETILSQVKDIVVDWRQKLVKASPKSSQWVKARSLVRELETLIFPENSEIVTKSESLSVSDLKNIEAKTDIDIVTKSENFELSSSLQLSIPFSSDIASIESRDIQSQYQHQLKPLNRNDLAQRLKITISTINVRTRKINLSNFSAWSGKKDPLGIKWRYNKKDGLFYPLD
jgi:hypothetical protein